MIRVHALEDSLDWHMTLACKCGELKLNFTHRRIKTCPKIKSNALRHVLTLEHFVPSLLRMCLPCLVTSVFGLRFFRLLFRHRWTNVLMDHQNVPI